MIYYKHTKHIGILNEEFIYEYLNQAGLVKDRIAKAMKGTIEKAEELQRRINMRISAKGRYALKMLIDLAENNNGDYIPLNYISKRQNISKKFLEQIVPTLVKTGIIRANRGNRGGYQLKKPADICYVGDILRATEGELFSIDELNYESDRKIAFVLEGLRDTVNKYVDSISLQDIIEHQKEFYDFSI